MSDGSTDRGRFTPAEERLLAPVLDEIIPPSADGRLPGAGALGLARHVSRALGATPDMEAVIVRGLAALERLAAEKHPEGLAALPRDQRLTVLGDVLSVEPMFLGMLMFHTYVGYYQEPRVMAALGLVSRAPHPGGHPVEPTDLATLLEPVRRRGPLYRAC